MVECRETPGTLAGFQAFWVGRLLPGSAPTKVTEDSLLDLGRGLSRGVTRLWRTPIFPLLPACRRVSVPEPPPTSWLGERSMGQCGLGPAGARFSSRLLPKLRFEPVGNLELEGGGPRNWRLFGPGDRWLLCRTDILCGPSDLLLSVNRATVADWCQLLRCWTCGPKA